MYEVNEKRNGNRRESVAYGCDECLFEAGSRLSGGGRFFGSFDEVAQALSEEMVGYGKMPYSYPQC